MNDQTTADPAPSNGLDGEQPGSDRPGAGQFGSEGGTTQSPWYVVPGSGASAA